MGDATLKDWGICNISGISCDGNGRIKRALTHVFFISFSCGLGIKL